MTIGSPFASSVSGPGTALTKAIFLVSGDQAMLLPVDGKGQLVPWTPDRNFRPDPSGCAIIRPDFSPSCPRKAIHRPSGDQMGPEETSFSPPIRRAFPSSKSAIQI